MPELVLPFEPAPIEGSLEDLFNGGLFAVLPEEFQAACREKPFLLQYLHMLPLEEIGLPKYYPKLSRSMGDEKNPNLIYPGQELVIPGHVASPTEVATGPTAPPPTPLVVTCLLYTSPSPRD